MFMREQRKIRFKRKELGPYTLDRLERMAKQKEFDQTTEFLSVITDQWLPLVGIMEDFNPFIDSLKRLRKAGIKEVGLIGTEDDCPVCLSLCLKSYSIDNVPKLPPKDCKCFPWCRLSFGAVA